MQFMEEERPRGLAWSNHVIASGEFDESGTGDAGGDEATFRDRHSGIMTTMENKSRTFHKRKFVDYVYPAGFGHELNGILRRSGDTLQFVEPIGLFGRRFRHEQGGEYLAERRIVTSPS